LKTPNLSGPCLRPRLRA